MARRVHSLARLAVGGGVRWKLPRYPLDPSPPVVERAEETGGYGLANVLRREPSALSPQTSVLNPQTLALVIYLPAPTISPSFKFCSSSGASFVRRADSAGVP